jgi:hypothetical protein
MERTLIIVAAFALSCDSVAERDRCAGSTDCPVGQYCAHTPDGSVCWADAAAPVVSDVVATCSGDGCRRDSILHVTAAVTDETGDLLDASVALDLAGGPSVPMVRSGERWEADVELRRFPFEHFERSVVATVTARDGARNVSAGAEAAPVGVTRLRWVYDAGAPITSPAVMADGTAVLGVSAGTDQVLAVRADGTKAWSRSVGGSAFVTAAPAIGEHAIWVGSEDFNLYAVELDGSAVKAGVGVNVGGPIRGSVATVEASGKEWAVATSAAGFVGAGSNVSGEYARAGPTSAFFAGPIIGDDGTVFAATATGAASIQAYRLTTSPTATLSLAWEASIGVNASAPLAIDGAGNVWSGTIDGKLSKTTPGTSSGSVALVTAFPSSIVDSAVVLTSGDVVVGDDAGLLHRFTAAAAAVWESGPNLGAAVQSPMVLTTPEAPFIVPTAAGKVFAVRGDGSVAWSATLEAGKSIRAPNIHTPAAQIGPTMSTAYLTNAGGKLFAVIVDGELDASAPWPKAFHDPRNTNRAGPQP